MINVSPKHIISIPRPLVIVIATIFFVIAFVLFIISALVLVTHNQGKVATLNIAGSIAAQSCEVASAKLGFKFEQNSNPSLVTVTGGAFDSMSSLMARTDSLLGRCAGYELQDFCAGRRCSKPVKITLKLNLASSK